MNATRFVQIHCSIFIFAEMQYACVKWFLTRLLSKAITEFPVREFDLGNEASIDSLALSGFSLGEDKKGAGAILPRTVLLVSTTTRANAMLTGPKEACGMAEELYSNLSEPVRPLKKLRLAGGYVRLNEENR